MKLTICLLLLTSFVVSTPSCAASLYCMGCAMSTADSCSSCFNWGSGSVGARALASNACTNALSTTAVTDCKFYSGVNGGSTQTINNCSMCTKDFLNLNNNASPVTVTCSDTAANTTTCTGKVANCDQTACYTADGTNYVLACYMCSKGYSGSGTATENAGYSACATTSNITNCDYHYLSGASTLACYSCGSGYAVASTSTTCSAFTTDSNCRQLHSDGTCASCWHAYYWNTSTCKLRALVTVLSAMTLAILAL